MKNNRLPFGQNESSDQNDFETKFRLGSTKIESKGVRLKWTALNDVQPIVLSRELTSGKLLDAKELLKRNNSTSNTKLIP